MESLAEVYLGAGRTAVAVSAGERREVGSCHATAGSRTSAGAAAAWAHMVAGDIFVTRWMWVRCMEEKVSRKVMAPIVFFGIMLMPVGVALYMALVRPTKSTAS